MADFNRNSFLSDRVHPRDVRSRQRSRSPERVGRNDIRYESRRGERSGDRGRSCDSHKQGQPALRDIPPIRANGSPLHFQATSPLNDSRREYSYIIWTYLDLRAKIISTDSQNILLDLADKLEEPSNGYSFSNSSPHRPLDSTRLLGKTGLEQPRKATVINIKGRAAQEHQHASPATETVGVKVGNRQEKAPALRPSQNTAERIAASVSPLTRSPPGVSMDSQNQPTAVLTNIISDALKHLIDEITDMSSLKTKEKHAKTALEKRTAEYEKTKPNHDKFPPMREAQTLARKEAERVFQVASERVRQKDILLTQMAARTAEQVVPTMVKTIEGSTNQEKEKIQERMVSFEKTCEGVRKLFNDQKNLWETKQKADQTAQQGLEKKISELEKASQKDQDLWSQEKASLQTQINNINLAMKNVKTRQDELDEAIAPIPTMQTEISEVRKQSANKDQFERLKILLASVYTDISQLEKRADTQDSRLDTLDIDSNSYKQTIATIKNASKELETTIQKLSDGEDSLTRAVNTFKGRLSAVETKFADQTSLDELKGRLSLIESSLSSIPKPEAASISPAVNSRIKALEEQIKTVSAQLTQLAELKDDGVFKINPGLDALNSETNLLKARLNAIEQKASHMKSAITGLEAKAEGALDLLQFEDRLKKLSDHFGSLKPLKDNIQSLLSTPEQRQAIVPADLALSATQSTSNDAANTANTMSSSPGRMKERCEDAVNQDSSHDSIIKLKLDALEDKYNAKFQEAVATMLDETGASVRELVIEEVIKDEIKLSGIPSRLDAVEASVRALTASQETLDGSYASIKKSYDSLKGSLDTLNAAVTKQDQAILNAMNNLIGPAAGAAVRMIQQQSLFAPRSLEQKLMSDVKNTALNITTSLATKIEANTEAIGSLQSRVDNINTRDLHSAIVQTMIEQYPNIQDTQLKLTHLQASQLTLEANIQTLKLKLQEVQEFRPLIPENKPEKSALETYQKEHRKEIEATREKLSSLAKQTDKQVRDLSIEYAETNEKTVELAEAVEKLRRKVAEMENMKAGRVTNQQPQPSQSASGAPISRATFGTPAPREASGSGEAGNTLKRKLASGSSPGAQNGGFGSLKGVSNGATHETSIQDSPAKRTRRSEKHLSYEPEDDGIPQTVTAFTAGDGGEKQ
ncbi:hypothetical protein JHW43_003645 [Diplocarpon mali]|nr:hypothetical protein JHW43_003645 [Diplocarpon mali]